MQSVELTEKAIEFLKKMLTTFDEDKVIRSDKLTKNALSKSILCCTVLRGVIR